MSDRLEQELRAALRREDAPEGFAERVLAEAARRAAAPEQTVAVQGERSSFREWFAWPRWALAAAACASLAFTFGWMQYVATEQQTQEHARLEAGRQVMFALRLASRKTAPARRALDELGVGLDGDTAEFGQQ